MKSSRELLDEIIDEFWGSLQSDLEHGVKCLNENAAKKFSKEYPNLSEFCNYLSKIEDTLDN